MSILQAGEYAVLSPCAVGRPDNRPFIGDQLSVFGKIHAGFSGVLLTSFAPTPATLRNSTDWASIISIRRNSFGRFSWERRLL